MKTTIWYKQGKWKLNDEIFTNQQDLVDYANHKKIKVTNKTMLEKEYRKLLKL